MFQFILTTHNILGKTIMLHVATPFYFKLPVHLIEDHFQQGYYIEDCEEAINEMIVMLSQYGFTDVILKWHLADEHENPQLWLLYLEVKGIDGVTAGLIENQWLRLLQFSKDVLVTSKNELSNMETLVKSGKDAESNITWHRYKLSAD